MRVIASWKFIKKNMPMKERYALKNQLKIFHISPINPEIDFSEWRRSDSVLVTGDGSTLPDDVSNFEQLGIEHDVFCVNRSLLYFQRPVNHWAAIDAEESAWLSENLTAAVIPFGGRILRHTIGHCPFGYDVGWKVDQKFDNERQKDVWSGNSGYFGILAALKMGYKRVIVAGMPLNTEPHWYESKDIPGPNWVGQTYRTWMDFKREHPDAERVRSMSGYSEFIFGGLTEKWLHS